MQSAGTAVSCLPEDAKQTVHSKHAVCGQRLCNHQLLLCLKASHRLTLLCQCICAWCDCTCGAGLCCCSWLWLASAWHTGSSVQHGAKGSRVLSHLVNKPCKPCLFEANLLMRAGLLLGAQHELDADSPCLKGGPTQVVPCTCLTYGSRTAWLSASKVQQWGSHPRPAQSGLYNCCCSAASPTLIWHALPAHM